MNQQSYIDVEEGEVHATTFNGYELAKGCAKDVIDSDKASALTNSGESLVTERKVFYYFSAYI
mgnify:CR=1 FL=1